MDEPDFPNGSAEALHDLLLKTEIDIEHIEACNHKDETLREQIWSEWGPNLHSLGNLIVLERSRHRGSEVSNHEYAVKRTAYGQSRFATVRGFAESLSDLIERCGAHQSLQRRIALLTAKVNREKQFNRKVGLNQELKPLQAQLAAISKLT